MMVPFLFELKEILDWACIPTSLDLFMWLKQQSLFASLFATKCEMERRRRDGGYVRGRARSKLEKMTQGFILVGIILVVFVGPIILYSPANLAVSASQLDKADVNIALIAIDAKSAIMTSAYPLYVADRSARIESIDTFSNGDDIFTELQTSLLSSSATQTQNLLPTDKANTFIVQMEEYSSDLWSISPPRRDDILTLLLKDVDTAAMPKATIYFELTVEFARSSNPAQTVTYSRRSTPLTVVERKDLAALVALNTTSTTLSTAAVKIANIYPKAFRLTQSGDTAISIESKDDTSCSLSLSRTVYDVSESGDTFSSYWSAQSFNTTSNENHRDMACDASLLVDEGSFHGNGPSFVVVVNPSFTLLGTLGVNSFLTFYTVIFLGLGGLFRSAMVLSPERVPYIEMPHPDELLQLCRGIEIVRREHYAGHLRDEWQLFAMLLRLYRSPEKLLRITHRKLD
jgi:hypothetical protein